MTTTKERIIKPSIPKRYEWICVKCDGKVVPTRMVGKGMGGMWCVCQGCGEMSPNMRDVAREKYGR